MSTDKGTLKKLSRAMADIEQIREAHLPEVLDIGSGGKARPVLFVLVDEPDQRQPVEKLLKKRLAGPFGGNRIEIRAISSDFPLLETIREVNCLVGWRD